MHDTVSCLQHSSSHMGRRTLHLLLSYALTAVSDHLPVNKYGQ